MRHELYNILPAPFLTSQFDNVKEKLFGTLQAQNLQIIIKFVHTVLFSIFSQSRKHFLQDKKKTRTFF